MIFGLKQFVQNNRTVSEGHKGYAGDEDDEGEDRDKVEEGNERDKREDHQTNFRHHQTWF